MTDLSRVCIASLLAPSELVSLGSPSLDLYLDALQLVYEQLGALQLLPVVKTQLMQMLMQSLTHGIMGAILQDAKRCEEMRSNEGVGGTASTPVAAPAPTPASKSSKSPKSTAQQPLPSAAVASSSSPGATSLISRCVDVGMKVSMVHAAVEDWSQRLTAFAHPFVQATRLAIAPLKELALFCLIDDKRALLASMADLQMVAPCMPRALLLALVQAYNADPANKADRVSSRVVKQLSKAVDKEHADAAAALGEAMQHADAGAGTAAGGREALTVSVSPPATPAHADAGAGSISLSSSSWSAAIHAPFPLSVDLGAQLGKFVLSAVTLPAQITAQPAFAFLLTDQPNLVL